MEERLQKYLAKCGIASRRECEEIIKEGRVAVNGKIIKEMGYIVSNVDTVLVDGIEVNVIEDKVYYMLNKPTGYVSTMKDDRGRKTIASLISDIDERESRQQNIKELMNAITETEVIGNNLDTIVDFLDNVTLMTDLDMDKESDDAVSLMTMHSSKGLEFKVVFLVSLENGIIPSLRADDEEEERKGYIR